MTHYRVEMTKELARQLARDGRGTRTDIRYQEEPPQPGSAMIQATLTIHSAMEQPSSIKKDPKSKVVNTAGWMVEIYGTIDDGFGTRSIKLTFYSLYGPKGTAIMREIQPKQKSL